ERPRDQRFIDLHACQIGTNAPPAVATRAARGHNRLGIALGTKQAVDAQRGQHLRYCCSIIAALLQFGGEFRRRMLTPCEQIHRARPDLGRIIGLLHRVSVGGRYQPWAARSLSAAASACSSSPWRCFCGISLARSAVSISLATAGLSFRYWRAFSLP